MSDPSKHPDCSDPETTLMHELAMHQNKTETQKFLDAVDEAKAKARPWIPTHGADLSGHDFGCEWIWLYWDDDVSDLHCVEHLERIEPDADFWAEVTHYMATAIRTPSPPEESNG